MKNKLKIRIGYDVFCIIIGAICFIIGLKDNSNSFVSGFGISFALVSLLKLLKNILIIRNETKIKRIEIIENDERNNKVMKNAYSLTFRICVLSQALLCILFVVLKYEDLTSFLAKMICFEMIIAYLMFLYYNKKM